MNKKVMALAVAGALASPAVALAQVGVSGSIHLQYFNHDPGSTMVSEKKTDILETTEPNIVIRGEEKLGGGISAWFACESSFDVLGSSIEGFCGRNSGVGMRGGFGNFFAGNWDTPHKIAVGPHRGWFGLNNVFARATILWNNAPSNVGNGFGSVVNGVTASAASAAGFSRRQAQTWNYHSPNFGGASFQVAYSGGNEGTQLDSASPLKPRLLSLGGAFATGPLIVTVGYEQHKDYNPTGRAAVSTPARASLAPGGTIVLSVASVTGDNYTGGSDDSIVVGVSYTIAGAVKLGAVYTKNSYEVGNSVGAPATLEVDGYAFWLDWRLAGPHSVKAQYVMLNDPEGTAGTTVGNYSVGLGTVASPAGDRGGTVVTLVYSYAFSKRTSTYFAYNTAKNDANTATASTLGQTASTLGGTQKAFGIGMRHSF